MLTGTPLTTTFKQTTPHTALAHSQDLIGDITSPLLLLGFGIFVWYKRREDKRRRNVVARVRLRHIMAVSASLGYLHPFPLLHILF